jgi:hypothetical protein
MKVMLRNNWRYLIALLAMLVGLAILGQGASASDSSLNAHSLKTGKFHPATFTNAAPQTVSGNLVNDQALFADYVINVMADAPTSTPTRIPTVTGTHTPVQEDAFMYFVPQGSAPPNGGTVMVGDRFVLDLMLNSGTHDNVTAQQSYLTYTANLVQSARVDQIATACVLTNTVTPDLSSFDTRLQNEVCNGPGQCSFRGVMADPGSFAYSSAGSTNCVSGCGRTFRVAQVGLCAVAAGQALLHWQFAPPAPLIRDSEIFDHDGALVHNPSLYTDYVINITSPTPTPGMMGHGTWEGRSPQPDPSQILPISLTLHLVDGGPYIDYPLQNTDASGHFTVSVAGLPSGTYDWQAEGSQYLANVGTVTLTGAPMTYLEVGLLRAGDANGDNIVNVLDFAILKGSYAEACGQVGYDPRSEFTGDCLVNSQDFILMKRNWGLKGASMLR